MNCKRLFRAFALVGLGFGAFSLTACGESETGPKLYPVRGKVFVNDTPYEGATVVFVPVDEKLDWRPTGKTASDGSFSVTTHPHGEGAPSGEYIVVITHYPPDAREKANPKSELPKRYADPQLTKFRAHVHDKAVDLEPFKLVKKGKE